MSWQSVAGATRSVQGCNDTSMTVPDWRTHQAGTRVRVALWLHSEVPVGSSFTKAQLRDAFPGVEQVDRRMRDLRASGK